MARYAEIKARMTQLQDDGFYELCSKICDLEAETDDQAARIDALEKENEAMEHEIERLKDDGDQS